jgi:uncharacterized protein
MKKKQVVTFSVIFFIISILVFILGVYKISTDFSAAYDAQKKEDYTTAFNHFKFLSELGFETAQINLAQMYEKGQGTPENKNKAYKWFLKAAEKGNSNAQLKLVFIYFQDGYCPDVKKNNKAGFSWLKKAATQKNAEAQYLLGKLYSEGPVRVGVKINQQKALKWLTKAAEQGGLNHQIGLSGYYFDLERQEEKNDEYYLPHEPPKRCKRCLNIHRKIDKNSENTKEGLKWLRKAAKQKYNPPQLFLANKLEELGENKEAFQWYLKAAKRNTPSAKYKVGEYYITGKGGVAQDYQEAVRWFEKSANNGDVKAQEKLGLFYYQGKEVPQNFIKAHMWLSLVETEINKFSPRYRKSFEGEREITSAQVESKMTPEQIAEAQRMVREWLQKDKEAN